MLTGRRVASGATVRPGDPAAEWINCSIILIDVPVVPVEQSLIRVGMTADVLLEGESDRRHGRVILIRGSSAQLSRFDLVTISPERREDSAEVVIDISEARCDLERCPVGESAFVDFPGIDLMSVVFAWLRL